MARRHAPSAEFPAHLRALYERFPLERSLAEDPLSCVRGSAASPRSAEIAGIVASTLAIGNTTAIRGAFARFLERAQGDLEGWVERAGDPAARARPFQHRWIRADQMDYLAGRLRAAYAQFGSLEAVYLDGRDRLGGCAGGIDALAHALRGPGSMGPAPPGYDRLFPSPLDPSHSPCKRLALFLRWMVRREYPDLGLWTHVDPAELCVPLDQHVFWIAYHLGLTARRTRSWAAATEVTDALRAVDPRDPVRFDFVLCHTGISGDCPKERDLRICGNCSVRPDCRLWHGARRAG